MLKIDCLFKFFFFFAPPLQYRRDHSSQPVSINPEGRSADLFAGAAVAEECDRFMFKSLFLLEGGWGGGWDGFSPVLFLLGQSKMHLETKLIQVQLARMYRSGFQ